MLHDGNTFSVFRFGESRGNLNKRSTCSPTASQAIPSFSQHHARFSSDLKMFLSQKLQGTPQAFRTPFRWPGKTWVKAKEPFLSGTTCVSTPNLLEMRGCCALTCPNQEDFLATARFIGCVLIQATPSTVDYIHLLLWILCYVIVAKVPHPITLPSETCIPC